MLKTPKIGSKTSLECSSPRRSTLPVKSAENLIIASQPLKKIGNEEKALSKKLSKKAHSFVNEPNEETSAPETINNYQRKLTKLGVRTDTAYKKKMKKLLKIDKENAVSSKPKRQQLYLLYRLIINRKKFMYHNCHAINAYFRCFNLRSPKSLKERTKSGNLKRYFYFQKAK